jgi:hypothetical protein
MATEDSSASGDASPEDAPPAEPGPGATDEKDVVRRFAERGEEALHRLAGISVGAKALRAASELGHRVDELSRKARGIDELEARVERLERELDELRARE